MISRLGCAALLRSAVLLAAGCGGSSPSPAPAAAPAPAAPAKLHVGPLTDYVAAAGLRWLVIGRPAELAEDQSFVAAVSALLQSQRLDAFATTTGIDLRKTPHALAAGFDYGTLYMAETPGENAQVQELFTERLLRGARVEHPHPELYRVSGLVGDAPQTLIRIDRKLVAVAVGDPTPARVVEGFARRRLTRSPAALRGAALSALPPELGRDPISFYAPGPFDAEWEAGARGLLAGTTAVGASFRPSGAGELQVAVYMAGAWGEVPEAPERLVLAWDDLARSPLGHLLGLDRARGAPAVETRPELLIARLALDLEPLVRGLRAAVAADAREILDLYYPSGVKSPVPQKTPGEIGDADAGSPGPGSRPGSGASQKR